MKNSVARISFISSLLFVALVNACVEGHPKDKDVDRVQNLTDASC